MFQEELFTERMVKIHYNIVLLLDRADLHIVVQSDLAGCNNEANFNASSTFFLVHIKSIAFHAVSLGKCPLQSMLAFQICGAFITSSSSTDLHSSFNLAPQAAVEMFVLIEKVDTDPSEQTCIYPQICIPGCHVHQAVSIQT